MPELPASFVVRVDRPGADLVSSARLPTATLHEASGRRGALPGAIRPVDRRMRLCGPAITVSCPPGDNLRIHHAIYAAQSGDVLIVATEEGHDFGYWGEVLTVAAQERALGGLVIDGGVRDSDKLRELRFPVFSRGLSIRGTGKDPSATGSINHPIRIGDVVVRPGDLVVGDADGVVVVERHRIAEVVELSHRRETKEAAQMQDLRNGARSIDLYGFDPYVLC